MESPNNIKIPLQNNQQQPQIPINQQILSEAYKDGLQAEYSLRGCLSKLILIQEVPINDLFNAVESLGRIHNLNEKIFNSMGNAE